MNILIVYYKIIASHSSQYILSFNNWKIYSALWFIKDFKLQMLLFHRWEYWGLRDTGNNCSGPQSLAKMGGLSTSSDANSSDHSVISVYYYFPHMAFVSLDIIAQFHLFSKA